MPDKAQINLEKARIRLIEEDCPFWGILSMGVNFVEDKNKSKTLGTMSTDGTNIYWDRAYVESLDVPELEYVIAHEMGGHKGLLHHIRLREMMNEGPVDMRTFNVAADEVIAQILDTARIGRAPKGIYHCEPRFADKSVEQVYNTMMGEKKQQPQPQEQEDDQKDQPGQGQEDDQSSGQGQNQQEEKEDTDGQGQGEREGQDQEDEDGEGQGEGQDGQGEGQDGDDPNELGGVLPAPEQSEDDLREREEDDKAQVRQAFNASKKAGHMPEGLRKLVEGMLEPKVDYRSLLREYMEERAHNDFSWRTPNKNTIQMGMYLPSMDGRELGEVCVLIDHSGSISDDQARNLLSEAVGIVDEYPNSTLNAIFFADRASNPIPITCQEDVQAIGNIDVGYGTDYIPAFNRIKEDGLTPVVTIVLTDGYCGSFPEYVDGAVIWIIDNRHPFHPPFGDVIVMEDQV